MFETLPTIATQIPLATTVLATIGGIWAASKLYTIADFTYTNFLRRSSLDRYKSSTRGDASASWALVTGASDGIGRGFAEELCHRGFNVILHGRNEKKLNDVRADLLQRWPGREIKLFVFDATGSISDLEQKAQGLKDLNLRILINNVTAGQRPFLIPLAEDTASRVGMFIDVDVRFLTEITRLLLPQLIKRSPSLIINMGSLNTEVPCPYGSIITGVKSYNKAWSRALSAEMKSEGHDVEVIYISVAGVANTSLGRSVGTFVPTSRRMASSTLDKAGCGKAVIAGYWLHALQFLPVMLMPSWVSEKIAMSVVKTEMAKEAKVLKGQ